MGETKRLNGPVSIVSLFDKFRHVGKAHWSESLIFVENQYEKSKTFTTFTNVKYYFELMTYLEVSLV